MTVAGPRRIHTGFPSKVRILIVSGPNTAGRDGVSRRDGSRARLAQTHALELVFVETEIVTDLVQ